MLRGHLSGLSAVSCHLKARCPSHMLFSDTFDNFKSIQSAASHITKLADSPDYSEPVQDYFKATDDANDGITFHELDMETYVEPSNMNSKTGDLCIHASLLVYYI